MPENRRDVRAKCPFYRQIPPNFSNGGYRNNRIGCEGTVPGMTITLGFRSTALCRRYFDVWCAGRFEACEIYRAICEAKYSGDD